MWDLKRLGGLAAIAVLASHMGVMADGMNGPGIPAAAPRLEVRDFVGTLIIQNGGEAIELANQTAIEAFPVHMAGDGVNLTLSGELSAAPNSCVTQNGRTSLQFGEAAPIPLESLPRIELLAPASLELDISGFSGALKVEEVGVFLLNTTGCSRTQLGKFSRRGTVTMAPGAQLEIENGAEFTLNASGARVSLGTVTGRLAITMARAGETRVARHDGELLAELGSVARLSIADGRSIPADIRVGRASRFSHGGQLDALNLDLGPAARAELSHPGENPVIHRGPASRLSLQRDAASD